MLYDSLTKKRMDTRSHKALLGGATVGLDTSENHRSTDHRNHVCDVETPLSLTGLDLLSNLVRFFRLPADPV